MRHDLQAQRNTRYARLPPPSRVPELVDNPAWMGAPVATARAVAPLLKALRDNGGRAAPVVLGLVQFEELLEWPVILSEAMISPEGGAAGGRLSAVLQRMHSMGGVYARAMELQDEKMLSEIDNCYMADVQLR